MHKLRLRARGRRSRASTCRSAKDAFARALGRMRKPAVVVDVVQARMLLFRRERRRGHVRCPLSALLSRLELLDAPATSMQRGRRLPTPSHTLLPQAFCGGSSSSEFESSPRGSKMSSGSPFRSEKPTSQRNHPHKFSSTPPNPLVFLFFSTNRVRPAIASQSYLPAPERDKPRSAANTRSIWTVGATCRSRRMAPGRKRGSAKRSAVAVLRTPPDRWPYAARPHQGPDVAEKCPLSVGRGQMRQRRQ